MPNAPLSAATRYCGNAALKCPYSKYLYFVFAPVLLSTNILGKIYEHWNGWNVLHFVLNIKLFSEKIHYYLMSFPEVINSIFVNFSLKTETALFVIIISRVTIFFIFPIKIAWRYVCRSTKHNNKIIVNRFMQRFNKFESAFRSLLAMIFGTIGSIL